VSSAGAAGDAMQDARARFRRGVQLYNEGSFEAALAEFNKAYQITPNYKILYNIAQTQFDLHDYVGASKNLEQYMKEGSREISEERRTAVNELNRKLVERIGEVEVTCNLDEAEIRVDDVAVGVSPLTAAVPVNAGPRRITAVKVGYPMVSQWVTVPGMEKKLVRLEIAEDSGTALAARAGAGSGREGDLLYQSNKKSSSRIGLITSSALAGGCAIATGVFGILALQAKNDFDGDLKKVPGNQDKIDSDRSKMKSYALATDILAGATVLSAAAAVYFLFTDNTESRAPKTSGPKRSVAVAPTVGGLVVQGVW
jgi:tetratricopeptide (TPR) repeat protein